jgi:hypothetical protein
MHSNSTFLPQTKTGTDLLIMLTKATQEGKAAAADLCSSRLEKLAAHAARDGLSAPEIIELIREEAEAITSKGGAAWQ